MFLRSLLMMGALVGFSGCLVTQTTVPERLIHQKPQQFTVKLDSVISYGKSMRGSPTLCVSAPESWHFEALNYKGLSADGALEGTPSSTSPQGMSFELPEGYDFTCWIGPHATYDLTSHGKLRMSVTPDGDLGAVELTFIAGYNDGMNFFEYPETVEVITEEVANEIR